MVCLLLVGCCHVRPLVFLILNFYDATTEQSPWNIKTGYNSMGARLYYASPERRIEQ